LDSARREWIARSTAEGRTISVLKEWRSEFRRTGNSR
jgi:hypothetical protein